MTKIFKKDQKQSYQSLYEELEMRYGAGLAQEIMVEIKKADDKDYNPDYMPVKALSEVLEIFRAEAKETVKKLKKLRSYQYPEKVVSLEIKRLQNELKLIFNSYWLAQHSFYTLYERALKICEVPAYKYHRVTEPTKMKNAA